MQSNRILPSFFIIGVQKAGTTSLASYLDQHPQLFSSIKKETDYFIKYQNFDKSKYASFFKQKRWWTKKQISYESSVGYFFFNETPARIYEYNPEVKFILLVRNPGERAVSAWKMYRNFFNVKDSTKWNALENVYKDYFNWMPTQSLNNVNDFYKNKIHQDPFKIFTDEIEQFKKNGMSYCEPGFIEKGLYYYQIKNYLKYFKLNQFLIIDNNDLSTNPPLTLSRITEFIGCKQIDWNRKNLDFRHKSEFNYSLDKIQMKQINEFYKPYNEKFFDLINKDFEWD